MVYGMGNYVKILIVAVTLVLTGCKDWLDVTPVGSGNRE